MEIENPKARQGESMPTEASINSLRDWETSTDKAAKAKTGEWRQQEAHQKLRP
jgi:hypothetical protein